jgi:hypothetical protein
MLVFPFFQLHPPRSEYQHENMDIGAAYYAEDKSKIMVLRNKPPVWNDGTIADRQYFRI